MNNWEFRINTWESKIIVQNLINLIIIFVGNSFYEQFQETMIWMVFDDFFSVKICGAAQAYAPPFEKDLLRAFLCWWKQPGHSRMVWSWKRIIAASASKKGHYCWWFRHPKANHRFWMYNTMKIMGWLSQWPTFKLLGIRYLVGKIKFKLLFNGRLAEYKWDIHGYSSYQLVIFSTISIKISCDFFSLRKGFLRPCGLVSRTLCHEWKSYRTTTSPSSEFTDLRYPFSWISFKDAWNAKCPIFLGNFTPKTSNYCLKNSALGFSGT